MGIIDAIGEIQTTIGAVDGIRRAPTYPPDNISAYPFVVTYPGSGTIKLGPLGQTTALHDITVELHGTRKDLPRDLQRVYPFSQSIPHAINQDHKDGDYSTIKTYGDISQELTGMSWAGVETLGWRYTIPGVKLQAAASTSATAATGNENIADLCAAIQKGIRQDHATIRRAPTYPTEKASAYPFVATYPAAGVTTLDYGAATRTAYDLNIECHVASKGLARSIEKVVSFVDTIPQTILKMNLHAVARHVGDMVYTFGFMDWGGIPTIGWRFTVRDVVIESALL